MSLTEHESERPLLQNHIWPWSNTFRADSDIYYEYPWITLRLWSTIRVLQREWKSKHPINEGTSEALRHNPLGPPRSTIYCCAIWNLWKSLESFCFLIATCFRLLCNSVGSPRGLDLVSDVGWWLCRASVGSHRTPMDSMFCTLRPSTIEP